MFNPRDPRHNPEVSVFPWRRQESSSSADSPPHRPMKWAHSLSRRSFCRARSGLLALRAGVRRHSTMEDDFEIGGESRSFVSPVALRRERQRHIDSSELQTSSTQDDPELGIEMYRMSDPPVSPTSTTLPGPRLPAATESLVRSALESSSTLPLISHEHGPPLVPMPKASGVNSQTVPAQTHIHALPNDVPEISSETDGISETSVECLFAFPGIYQETLAQWSKEGKVSQSSDHDLPSNQEFEDHSRIEQTNNTIRPSPPGLLETPQSSTLAQEGAQLLRGDTSSDLEIPDGTPGEGSPSSERSTTYEPILGAAPMTGDFLPLLSVSFGDLISCPANITPCSRRVIVILLAMAPFPSPHLLHCPMIWDPKVMCLEFVAVGVRIPCSHPPTRPRPTGRRQKLPQGCRYQVIRGQTSGPQSTQTSIPQAQQLIRMNSSSWMKRPIATTLTVETSQ